MSFITVVNLFLQFRYPILVGLAFIEGPYIMMMSGFLIRVGTFSLVPTYIALSFGDLLADTAWYYFGYFFGEKLIMRRFGKYVDVTEKNIARVKDIFRHHGKKILLGSKMTMGFGFSLPVLIGAGMVEIPIGDFLLFNFLGQLWWTAVMLSVGYFFGNIYVLVNDVFVRVCIVSVALLSLFLLLRFSRYMGKRLDITGSEAVTPY